MLHIKSVKPLFTNLVTTADRFEKNMTSGGIILANEGDLKLWQKVLYVGSCVKDIEVGDMVMINFQNYAVKKYSKDSIQNDLDNNATIRYQFNWVTIDNEKGEPTDHLLLNDRDILYVFEGKEVDEPIIEIPNKKIIV